MATQTRQRAARTAARTPKANGDGAVVAAADLQPLLEALRAAARGEVGVRLDTRKRGIVGQLGKAFNDLAQTRERTTDEIVRVAHGDRPRGPPDRPRRHEGRAGHLAARSLEPSTR